MTMVGPGLVPVEHEGVVYSIDCAIAVEEEELSGLVASLVEHHRPQGELADGRRIALRRRVSLTPEEKAQGDWRWWWLITPRGRG